MRCWLFFNRDLAPDTPEAPEIHRFVETAKRLDIELHVLKPGEFDLVVDSKHGWSATYQGRDLVHKPDLIIPRCGAETSYFTLAVLRHFERQGVGDRQWSSRHRKRRRQASFSADRVQRAIADPENHSGEVSGRCEFSGVRTGISGRGQKLRGTRGNGVVLCQDRAQFDDLANLLEGASLGGDFLFQQYIKASHGRDVRILVIDGRVIAAMERQSAEGGFKSNISLGGSGRAFAPPHEMIDLALKVARELKLDVAGIDILFDENGYRVCEANSAPGFQGLERACGINVPETIFFAMGKKFGIPIRHSDRWEAAIEKAARAAFGKTIHPEAPQDFSDRAGPAGVAHSPTSRGAETSVLTASLSSHVRDASPCSSGRTMTSATRSSTALSAAVSVRNGLA